MKIMFLLAFGIIVFVIGYVAMIILFGDIIFVEEDFTWRHLWENPGGFIISVLLVLFVWPFLWLCILAHIQVHYILKTHIELHRFISQFKKNTDKDLERGPGRILLGTWELENPDDWENMEKPFIKSTYKGKINAYEEMESLIIDKSQIYANWKLHKEVYKCIRELSYDALCELGKLNQHRRFSNLRQSNLRQLGSCYGKCYAYYEMLIRMENFMYVISALDRYFRSYMGVFERFNIEVELEHPYFIRNNIVHPKIYKPPFRLNRQKWARKSPFWKSPFTRSEIDEFLHPKP